MDSDKKAASMGSVWPRLDDEHTPSIVVPKRRLSMGSIRTLPAAGPSKAGKIIEPKNEITESPTRCNSSSKSCETIEPMKQIDITPSRRITRSFKRPAEEGADHSTKRRMLVEKNSLQDSTYFIEPENRVSASINVFFKEDVISDLNKILTSSQKHIFSRTCFGHFLQMKYIRLQHQTIHKMLLMEVMQPNQNEMWFKVAGNLLRFSIQEFCMVTGLRCAGEDNLNNFKTGDCRLKRQYFGNIKNIYRKDVEQKFLQLPQNTPDNDVVKLGILYLVSSFLYTSPQPTVIKHELMRIIDSSFMDTFPWGKELYQNTHFYMKLALEKPKQMECDPKSIISYRLYGFPLAFQIWIYESIPLFSGVVCNRVSRTYPRILNWSTDNSRVSAADLDKMLYDLDVVEVMGTQPSDVELRAGYFVGLPIKEPAFKSVNVRRTDLDVVKALPHDNAKGKNKMNMSKEHFVHCSKQNNRDVIDQREPHRSHDQPDVLKLLGELQYHVLCIQDKQKEIINLQNDMKLDIQRVERFVEHKYEALLEEIRRKNNSGNRDYGNTDSDISKRTPIATETRAHGCGGHRNTPNNVENNVCLEVETLATNDDNNMLGQSDNVVGCEMSSKTIALETHVHNDIHFTEQDLIQVDHIVSSVQSMKHNIGLQNNAQITTTANMSSKLDPVTGDISRRLFHGVTTPNCLLDEPRQGVCCIPAIPKAPMMVGEPSQTVLLIEPGDENNNAATPARNNAEASIHSIYNTVGLINTPGSNINTNYRMYAITEGMAPPHIDDVNAFESWFQDGYNAGQIKGKFPASKDMLNPPLQFGPYVIDRKTWWYELRQPEVNLRDTHLNVCFYYFRKMVKFSKRITFNGTTTDTFFGAMVQAAYKSCSKDINAISNSRSLVEYAKGEYMHCNTRWTDVDNVIIPIMMDKKAHWILGHFDIKGRRLNVYNPNRHTIRDRMVSNDVEAFAYVLPCLMLKIHAWEASPADRIGLVTPLDVNIVTDIPHDENGHACGLYVIRFAEYIINGITDKASWKFDPNGYRLSLASQLLKHGCEKVIEAYDTDFDLVPRSVRRDRKMKGLTIE